MEHQTNVSLRNIEQQPKSNVNTQKAKSNVTRGASILREVVKWVSA